MTRVSVYWGIKGRRKKLEPGWLAVVVLKKCAADFWALEGELDLVTIKFLEATMILFTPPDILLPKGTTTMMIMGTRIHVLRSIVRTVLQMNGDTRYVLSGSATVV